ncbi:biotin--[acetyl-CoA-carboxylase] ligase [Terrimonas sp.]|uniref:biotin--[acetyl-CoA-carboxylase] ligase n=1 Tax=Terrimonas sp. TaxID=1914338 RepID=UPI000D50A563|nr:biotin--[acetyl-CoA-carboxylase] ligase [Terrimonas sp.]PVD51111.1 biotin--[acetyl-CoA-carboxylase] ligase [Terrimonas sp.]
MHSFGRFLSILDSVDSTNNYAMQKVHARLAKHGDAWLALQQTQGKGQRSKHWITEPGQNITISFVTEPDFLRPDNSFHLIAAVALGIYDFFKHYAGAETRIKWPNDIYWRDRKTVGILIENVIRDKKWLYAVIGVGININQTDFGAFNATSLLCITGKKYDVTTLAKELCGFLDKRYELLKSSAEAILLDYQNALYKLNEKVIFKKENITFEAEVLGITNDGSLIVNAGEKMLLTWGSVEWVIEK